jgi:hypothetical protein
MDPATISLIAFLLDAGIDRAIDIFKLFQNANADLPSLENIKAEIEKWQVRADAAANKIEGH